LYGGVEVDGVDGPSRARELSWIVWHHADQARWEEREGDRMVEECWR
jgi:hypothetical protein